MKDGYTSYITEEFKRVEADQEEAIMFLAKIIPKEDKERIRRNIENDPDFVGKQHMFLGMKVRNALRNGGFFYDPHMMDGIWFPWLKEAVCLPEDKIILTDSNQERIKKYQTSIKRPPPRPKLDPTKIDNIKEQLEKLHNIKLPEVEVRYSDNIRNAFAIRPTKIPRFTPKETRNQFIKRRNSRLKAKGLKDEELEGIGISEFTIFLRRRYSNYPVELYGELWHEMGHATAYALNVRDKTLNEGVAYACGFRGLLIEVKEGKLSLEEAVEQIKSNIKGAKGSFPFFPHRRALLTIEAYNPDLNFRNRNLDELIAELDRSIQDADACMLSLTTL